MTTLRGITWDHTRGFTSIVAAGQRFHELNPEVDFVWEKRSLQAFADEQLDSLAARFDLLVIDHPWAGTVARDRWLLPLEDWLDKNFLQELDQASVGESHRSYQYGGSQWALAIDAACPVSVWRPDLLEKAGAEVPATWEDVLALAERGLVGNPSIPLDVYGNFLNLCVSAGAGIFPDENIVVERAAGLEALARLGEFHQKIPQACFELNPIRTLERMSRSDDWAYCPYTYGYSTYSLDHYAPHRLRFGDVPSVVAGSPGRTMLGGTGLAVSSSTQSPDWATRFAAFAASREVQEGIFFDAGGQPGHRAAWLNPESNRRTDDFFTRTLPTLDRAFVRPRFPGYLTFQDHAGDPIHNHLANGGDPDQVLDTLDSLYREVRRKA